MSGTKKREAIASHVLRIVTPLGASYSGACAAGFSCVLFVGNVWQQSNVPCSQNGFPNCALVDC
ncbi:hypothetical protein KOR42_04560 [Thalassoglobus neptunius]|uniref:Uncharacterized protein n=1 Tax=Thalassoglobus neptunius TaxID=1938619 RepID=A0A5C5X2T6_9PLAN|nr:hypothetical protein KOR42_04560 [Thalassoglobus neptunius]